MDKRGIEDFLYKRHARINEIELANKLYIKIGHSAGQSLSHDPYDSGCVHQFFCYMQQALLHFIFNNFFAVIGSYDSKRDCLKSWEGLDLSMNNLFLLKEIRERYATVRNNFLAHIAADFQPSDAPPIAMDQIQSDIDSLRDIFNDVRMAKGIPILVQGCDVNEHSVVHGVQILFKQLMSEPQDV